MYTLAKEEGFGRKGLFKGVEASAMREASYSTLRIGLYEPIKRKLCASDNGNSPQWKKFAAGAIAGLIGSGLANPFDLIKTRMQS